MTLHEAAERIIATHQISREKVIASAGEIRSLSDESCRRLLLDLVDGGYGGISAKPPHDEATPLQTVRIYHYARLAFGQSFMPRLRAFILTIYPAAPEPRLLTRRQSARIIIELDQKIQPGASAT